MNHARHTQLTEHAPRFAQSTWQRLPAKPGPLADSPLLPKPLQSVSSTAVIGSSAEGQCSAHPQHRTAGTAQVLERHNVVQHDRTTDGTYAWSNPTQTTAAPASARHQCRPTTLSRTHSRTACSHPRSWTPGQRTTRRASVYQRTYTYKRIDRQAWHPPYL